MHIYEKRIIEKSVSKNYIVALTEWDFHKEFIAKEKVNCVCGKEWIHNVFIFKNRFNNETISCGEQCAKRIFHHVSSKAKNLEKKLLSLSVSNNIQNAKSEWRFFETYCEVVRKTTVFEKEKVSHRRVYENMKNGEMLDITKFESYSLFGNTNLAEAIESSSED